MCVCVCFLYQGKEVCLWFLIFSAPQTPADPLPFIPYPTCKPLDLWLAVSKCVCVLVDVDKTKSVLVYADPLPLHLHVCMPCRSLSLVTSFFLQSFVVHGRDDDRGPLIVSFFSALCSCGLSGQMP